jgi:hypothetical protein
MRFDTRAPCRDTSPRPEGMQLATMLRRFAAVANCHHHIATVPTYETRGGHESRALQVTLPPGTFPFFPAIGSRSAPCAC